MKITTFFLISCLTIFSTCKNSTSQTSKTDVVIKQDSILSTNQNKYLVRQTNETIEGFAERAGNKISNIENSSLEITSEIIETSNWISNASTIIVFYKSLVGIDEPNNLIGYVFLSNDNKNYTYTLIDDFYPEGSGAEIETVFFANADNDHNNELVILFSWKQNLKKIAEGKLYETRIYDDFSLELNIKKLTYLDGVSEKIGIEFDGFQDGNKIVAKYKTTKNIKAKLQNLGY